MASRWPPLAGIKPLQRASLQKPGGDAAHFHTERWRGTSNASRWKSRPSGIATPGSCGPGNQHQLTTTTHFSKNFCFNFAFLGFACVLWCLLMLFFGKRFSGRSRPNTGPSATAIFFPRWAIRCFQWQSTIREIRNGFLELLRIQPQDRKTPSSLMAVGYWENAG